MLAWVAENAKTLIALAVLVLAVGLAVLALVRGKKRRSGDCTGVCAACGAACPYKER